MEQLNSETLRKSGEAQKAMHAEHAAKSCLQSGATVKRAISICEEHAATYVDKAVDQVSAVAQDIDAFTVITSSLTAMFRGLEAELAEAVRLASAGSGERFPSVQAAGNKLFAEMRTRLFKQLEIHRFSFVKPSKGDLAAQKERLLGGSAPSATAVLRKNSGGKALAKHWDSMWADIAVQLWAGDFEPKSQADIKRVMFEWLNKNEFEAGDTAVTARARALWQRMQEED